MNHKKNKTIAITFHGFLGSSDDFHPLEDHFEVFHLDLKPKNNESWGELLIRVQNTLDDFLKSKFDSINGSEIYIFSYSMGSKVLFSILDFLIPRLETLKIKFKLILISTHFGIYENELKNELELRSEMNTNFLKIIKDNNLNLFLEKWSTMPLFNDEKKTTTNWTIIQIQHYFQFWNQTQLQSPSSKLKNCRTLSEIYLVYGERDQKYKNQTLRFIKEMTTHNSTSVKVIAFENRGHRLLNPEDLDYILSHLGASAL